MKGVEDMNGSELLQYALEREKKDQSIYTQYARKTSSQGLVQLLHSLIDQEDVHIKELNTIAERGDIDDLFAAEKLARLDHSSFETGSAFSPEMTTNDFLNHLIELKESGVRFYSALAGMCSDEELSFTFNNLSFEEQKHKNWAMDRYELEMLSSM